MKVSTPAAYRHTTRTVVLTAALLLALGQFASAQQVTMDVGSGTGTPGGTAAITVSITGAGGLNVSAAQVDVLFDATTLSFANIDPTSHQVADCVVDSRFASGFATSASIVTHPAPPEGQNRLQLGVVSTTNPIQTFGDGPLFTCTFQIAAAVPLSTVLTLTGDRPLVTDNLLNNVPASPTNGTITVSEATPTPTLPTPTATPIPCVSDPDCPSGRICLNQVCETVTCSAEMPCPSGICVDGFCTAAPTPTVTEVPTATPSSTPVTPPTTVPTATRTATLPPAATATTSPTRTVPPAATATNTSVVDGGAAGSDDDGCNIGTSSTASGSLWWLLVPVAVVLWKRRSHS